MDQAEPIIRDKAEYHLRTTAAMERHFTTPDWTMPEKLALACRMLAAS